MASGKDEQGRLFKKVVNITDVKPKDQKTGQIKLFGTAEEFVPGFSEWAEMMNGSLSQSQKASADFQSQNEALRNDMHEQTRETRRLANSLETIIPKFMDISVTGEGGELIASPYNDLKQADVALVDTALPGEMFYTLTSSDIADKVGNSKMTSSMMGRTLRVLKIYGNSTFHCAQRTGKKGICHKYKPQTIEEIYKRIADPTAYGLNPMDVAKVTNYIRPREAMS